MGTIHSIFTEHLCLHFGRSRRILARFRHFSAIFLPFCAHLAPEARSEGKYTLLQSFVTFYTLICVYIYTLLYTRRHTLINRPINRRKETQPINHRRVLKHVSAVSGNSLLIASPGLGPRAPPPPSSFLPTSVREAEHRGRGQSYKPKM